MFERYFCLFNYPKDKIAAFKDALDYKGVSVVIAQETCTLFAKGRKMLKPRSFYVTDKCKNHRLCIGTFTCPAFSIQGDFPVIDPDTCVGCAVCAQICPENAILPLKK